ncbi:FecR protein [Variovorax sp. SRS16]|uniref:FecR domain-containing protein n=1 Tax=Variovorax sp. SRS16 TaxID=282217 RepID=UPI001316F0FB|nr:FecR domain-containing protein [Variovorax sp. SRS16]VTU31862.1 FecR protein [Variovorax sp. SRS16]
MRMTAARPDAPARRAHAIHPLVRIARGSACAVVALHLSLAAAQAPQPGLVHRVQSGDTLYELAERYTGRADHWPRLQRLNAIADPRRIAPGTPVRIPADLLASMAVFATAAYVTGDVQLVRPGETQAHALQAGMDLPQGSTLTVGLDGFARLRLSDGSVVRIPAGSRVRLSGVAEDEAAHAGRTIIQMEAGRVDASVRPRRNKASRFEVHTPLAIASVRGTEFGVAIQRDAAVTSEVLKGEVVLQDRHGRPSSRRLLAGQGVRVDGTGRMGPVRALPEAPDLSTLPDTVTDADFVRLQLPAAPGVAAWRVRIATDAALEQVVRDGMASDGRVQFAGLDDGAYTLGVRAADEAGLLGRESTRALRVKATPVAPLFERPAPDEKVVGRAVALSCTQPAGIRRFRLQVAKDEHFETPEIDAPALDECRYQASLPPGRYFWRVASVRLAADGATDQGPFGGSQGFELVAPPPQAPVASIDSDDEALQVHWSGTAGERYRIQVARDGGFADLVHDGTQAEPLLHLSGQAPGTYYVRLQAIDAQGQAGAFSAAQAVRIGGAIRDSSGAAVRDGQGHAWGRP